MSHFLHAPVFEIGIIEPIERISALISSPGLLSNLKAGGLKSYSRARTSLTQMWAHAIEKCLQTAPSAVSDCDLMLVATDSRSPTLSADLQRLAARFKLSIPAVSIVSGADCANFQVALAMARHLIDAGACNTVLLVCGDIASEHDQPDRIVAGGMGIFSDAAAACIVSKVPSAVHLGPNVVTSDFTLTNLNRETQEAEFLTRVAMAIRANVDTALEKAAMTRNEVKFLLANNYNEGAVSTISMLCEFNADIVHKDNIKRFAHAYSCDNLINLATVLSANDRSGQQQGLLLATGAVTWSSTIVELG